ncbi:MAG: ATP-binding protein [Rhodospirillales bacterium]|nr:ATP-binding protein [Rhodospirillales bacterium]
MEFVDQALAGNPAWLRRGSHKPSWLSNFLRKSTLAREWIEKKFLADDPHWLEDLVRRENAKVARSFLLTGNVADYAFDPDVGYRPTVDLLIKRMLETKDGVVTFSLARGIKAHSARIQAHAASEAKKKPLESILAAAGTAAISSMAAVCGVFSAIQTWLASDAGDEFPGGVAFVFENIHLLVPAERGDIARNYLIDTLLDWSRNPALFHGAHCFILMAETLEDVAAELRTHGGKIEHIAIPRPGADQRLKFLMAATGGGPDMRETRLGHLPSGIATLKGYEGNEQSQLQAVCADTAGLTLLGIEDLLQEASCSHTAALERGGVLALKRERLRQESEGLLEVVEPGRTLTDIGGYKQLKAHIEEVVKVFGPDATEAQRETAPMGMLFLGPPGTGKTIMAEAIAGSCERGMAKLGDFRGMYVGQSERNLSRIFSVIESLTPVIVFVDEIDQAFGSRNASRGDGGVDSRVFGKLLEFMSDTRHRGRILWIGATNYPRKIDPAMKRAGRFDLAFPFLLPDMESRSEILQVVLKKFKTGHSLTPEQINALAGKMGSFSGAEIQVVAQEAVRRVVASSAKALDLPMFETVLENYLPSKEARKQYRAMEEDALDEVSFLDLMPEDRRRPRQSDSCPSP